MLKVKFHKINKANFKNRDTFWEKWIGSTIQFSLESRIFHSISLSLILLAIVYAPYNLFAGMYMASLSAALIAFFFIYQYYHSRFLGKPHNSIAFGLIGIMVFGANYFFNSGINGSTDLIWPVYLLVVLAISPYKQHLKWLIIYLFCFIIIHLIEYLNPSLVLHPFTEGKGQFLDRVTVFPLPVIVIYTIITFIRQSYDRERQAAEEKTIAVKASNTQILIQKKELEKSNLEKNRLMSIISHDLRTPLINVQNYLELLNEFEIGSSERLNLEKTLLTSTNNAMEMLSNLLNWSKSQMEGAFVHMAEINLSHTLSSTLNMESIHALKKGILLETSIPSEINVIADVDMLQLVVRNLISNALKFTPDGGKVNVNAELILNECKISVSDNGSGIAEDKQNQIFSISTSPEYGTNNEKGVGLGLVLCKEFIERQGGKISFESTLGIGSNFYIYIPAVIN